MLNSCLGSGPFQLASTCTRHNAKPTLLGWNMGFQMGYLDFILKSGFEPVFSPNERKRRSEPNQGWDKAVAKDRAERVMASNSITSHLDPFKSHDNPDVGPMSHGGLPSSTYLQPSPAPSSHHSTPLECPTLSRQPTSLPTNQLCLIFASSIKALPLTKPTGFRSFHLHLVFKGLSI